MAQRIAAEDSRSISGFSKSSEAFLLSHACPGNVRELQNALRRAIITGAGNQIDLSGAIPAAPRGLVAAQPSLTPAPVRLMQTPEPANNVNDFAGMTLDQIERMAIETAIARVSGNICKAARDLGVSPSTIYRKLESWAG